MFNETDNDSRAADTDLIGAPLMLPGGGIAHVAAILQPENVSYSLGSGAMERIRREFQIVDGDSVRTLPDTIAAPMLARAKAANIPPLADIAGAMETARKAEAERRAAMDRGNQERSERAKAFQAEAEVRIPSWAKAAIIAELEQDDSDSMTDYFNTITKRKVIIGFSKHDRDLFPELRAAAATFPETAALAEAPANAEHREKYSMGAGYYLKASSRYSSGWIVRKRKFYGNDPVQSLDVAEWHLPEAAPAKSAPGQMDSAAPGGMRIEEYTHTKKGFQMHICILAERVERETFDALRDKADAMGGWYSRPWGRTPGGFAFKERATAEAFAALDAPPAADGEPEAPRAPRAPVPSMGTAGKLRELADKLQADIDHAFRDRLSNTPKRMREAQGARLDGYRWQRTQAALRALAVRHEAGTVLPVLAGVKSKAAVYELMRSKIDCSRGGYYDAGTDTGKPAMQTPEALALWALVGGQTEGERAAEELRKAIENLQFANIAGYFPTPAPVVELMLERAEIRDGMTVLEPSAGSGSIIEAVKAEFPSIAVTVYEAAPRLADILQRKGYHVTGADFLEAEPGPYFDRVVMNPPFENGQDAAHVIHAFHMLKPGGRLIAIMSPGPFFRQDRKSAEFRAWFDSHGGEREELPEGSFKASGTGVAAYLVEVRK